MYTIATRFLNSHRQLVHFFGHNVNLIAALQEQSRIHIGLVGIIITELPQTRAILAGPRSLESTKIDLGPSGHLGNVLVIGIQGNADDAGTFGGLHRDLGFKRRRQNPNGLVGSGGGSEGVGFLEERGVVERGLREIGYRNDDRLAVSSLGLGGVDGEENSFEAGEGGKRGGVRGERVDSGEVEAGEEGEEGENDEP